MERYDNKERDYKSNAQPRQAPAELEFETVRHEMMEVAQKAKDPVFLATLMNRVTNERENTNRILKNIFARLDALDMRLRQLEGKGEARKPQGPRPPTLLPEVDYEILEFARQKGRVCAAEVKKKFNYRGVNAACARLNKLFEQGMMEKKQVGRKVFYFPMEVEVQKA